MKRIPSEELGVTPFCSFIGERSSAETLFIETTVRGYGECGGFLGYKLGTRLRSRKPIILISRFVV